jgi:hypothetical protein
MNEPHILIRLLRMYIPRNWEFGSALVKLRKFGGGGGVEPPLGTPLLRQAFACRHKLSIVFVYVRTKTSLKFRLFCWNYEPCLVDLEAQYAEGDVMSDIAIGNRPYDWCRRTRTLGFRTCRTPYCFELATHPSRTERRPQVCLTGMREKTN